jgi:hypothetical protein
VNWMVETALIYRKQQHPKTIPILARHFIRQHSRELTPNFSGPSRPGLHAVARARNDGKSEADDLPVQMTLLGRS